MIISGDYQADLAALPEISNEEFLLRQLWQLKYVFCSEIAAVKDTDCRFIGFTRYFAEEFGVNESLLGQTAIAIESNLENQAYDDIENQEREVIAEKAIQDSIYMHKKKDVVSIYAVRKRALINPYTGDAVGIFINTAIFVPNMLRKVLEGQVLHLPKTSNVNMVDKGLSKLQQQIIFCLIVGYNSRKDITNTLSNLTGNEYNETQVKNALQALYQKFECNTPTQLAELAIAGKIKLDIPADMLPAGAFPVKGYIHS